MVRGGNMPYYRRRTMISWVFLALLVLVAGLSVGGPLPTESSPAKHIQEGGKAESTSTAATQQLIMWNRWDRMEYYAPYTVLPAAHPSRALYTEMGRSLKLAGPSELVEISPPSKEVNSTASWKWEHAGGEFGLSGDWPEAISIPRNRIEGGDDVNTTSASLRGDNCSAKARRAEVWEVLAKRRTNTSSSRQVAVCVRTKDFGRFLPEWVAFHYAVGVDEIMIYDDDSIDNTREVLEPFINAGIVKYNFFKVVLHRNQMKPLNHCLNHYLERRRQNDTAAPSWLLFHDTDEYMFPVDTTRTLSEELEAHPNKCCLLVPRVQYGSGGYTETPRGLTLENFLTHAPENATKKNRIQKLVVNLDPAKPEMGVVEPPLPSMHGARGCTCEILSVKALRINHYVGSKGDFLDKTRRWWSERYSPEKAMIMLEERDVNDVTSDAILHWACATREVLARVLEGLNLESGPSLSIAN